MLDISPGYFGTLGVALTRGRAFTSDDGRPGNTDAIVNERFAEMFFSGVDPIGRRIALTPANAPPDETRSWAAVVGVVPSIRQSSSQDAAPVVYLPLQSGTPATINLMVRTSVDPTIGAILSGLLATVGLFAVAAHGVGLRTPVIAGFLIGLAGVFAWDRAFSGAAPGYAASPGKLLIVTLMMLALVVDACAVPIRRATRMHPVAALRQE